MPTTPSNLEPSTFTPEDWRSLASDLETAGEFAGFLAALGDIQAAVDTVHEDAADGFSCLEQVARLRDRFDAALRTLATEARKAEGLA